MTLPVRIPPTAAEPVTGPFELLPTEQLLLEGGDARTAIDAGYKTNKYGCCPVPDADMLSFGSSTASSISIRGFEAANVLRQRLLRSAAADSPHAVCANEMDRVRHELKRLCEIGDVPGLEMIFAASGTDLHLIAAQLFGGAGAAPTLVIMVSPEETGGGVRAAVAGQHFSSRSALGASLIEGMPIAQAAAIEVATVSVRLKDGTPRKADEIDADVESLVSKAAAIRQKVLLILVDVTKTGMVAPSIGCALALRRRWPDLVDVFVDACQFRIANATLRAYLENGFVVALTGSKFLTGPSFAGALLIPQNAAEQLRGRVLPRALSAYSSRSDWPAGWKAAEALDNTPNIGLLLRWEAALEELRAFRAVSDGDIERFLQAFASAVQNYLQNDPIFHPLPVPELDRRPLMAGVSWDRIATIFPFSLHRPPSRGGQPLNREETMKVYRLLQTDLASRPDLVHINSNHGIASLRCQLGQPVVCGEREGVQVSALRICASARLISEAAAHAGKDAVVIGKALMALEKVAFLVRNAI